MLQRILIILVILIFVIYAFALYFADNVSIYYSYDMFLGPLSKSTSILVLYTVEIVLAILLLITLKLRSSESIHLYFYVVFVLLVLFTKYFLPQYFDSAYFENFYDAGGHMTRGKYVTLTGHSDVRVDTYFDVQPAFFWWTAIFINIAYGTPSSPQDPVFTFLTKWFNTIILIIYLFILITFFKIVGLSLRESFLAYGIFLLISLTRFHYSAQEYSYSLYWLAMILMLRTFGIGKLRFADLVAYTLIVFSIIFVHQGTTLFTLVSVSAVLLGTFVPLARLRIDVSTDMRVSLFLLVVLLIFSWFIYLSYLTVYTFRNFIETIRSVVLSIVDKGIPSIVTSAVTRPYEPWMRIVLIKAIYMILLISVSLLTLLIVSLSKHECKVCKTSVKIFLYIASALTAVVGIIALTIGGAGYVERIPEALAPIISLSLLRIFNTSAKYSALRIPSMAIATILILLGSVLYFAGWNFQSISYSEAAAGSFAVKYGPNVAGVYSKLCIESLYYPVFPYRFSANCLYAEYLSNNIQAIYYLVGDPETIFKVSKDLTNNMSIVFRSPTASIYLTSS